MSKYVLPKKFIVKDKISEQNFVIKPKKDYWEWKAGGKKVHINWLNFKKDFRNILKLFILNRMKRLSIETISNGDLFFLRELIRFKITIPIDNSRVFDFLYNTSDIRNIYTFRKLYEFGLIYFDEHFNVKFNLKLREFKVKNRVPYEKVFLQQNFVSDQEVEQIRNFIKLESHYKQGFKSFRNNIILQIAFELAPRPSQLCMLNKSDFKYVRGKTKNYYSLNLPMSKKIKSHDIEKRERSITKKLGEKLLMYIKNYNREKKSSKSMAMFVNNKGDRLTSSDFTSIIKSELAKININRTPTDLRHNLAQSLADQGASAEIIAELLGHNSTVPARAYIASTPKIADIKTNALGKNNKYKKIMKMLTGDFKDENKVVNKQKVKGMVGSQYIGGIGKCGLPEDTICSKNPIYSCYSCIKFHPFKNKSQHINVKEELQKQAQYFLDITEKGNDIEHNRSVVQLEKTIAAVQRVIDLIDLKNE
ncbi:tyrosine-type recombinase/integrase [Tenacibaculum mesophilum]|uniref:tyrosine-type recombinase/integrase n=1 Tax=Tenacibaculum mesophilum TaxID=104268 RepID=UPI00142F6B2F|nr:tyrosine-type recombinase/integrase [Tenacibaculum mesophilum]KAF9657753.1 tyrosine-type recombinase/integrase [Tenacibaculum mesophilum]